jgi:FSR family fosmidomycin resistance protein-like MFS transporter
MAHRHRERAGAGPAATRTAWAEEDRQNDWRGFAYLTTLVVLRSIAYFGIVSLLALFMIRRFHEPTAVAETVLELFTGTGVIGTLVGGWLCDRWQRVGTLRLGYGLAVPGLLILALAPGPAVAFVATAILGIALFMPFAVQVTLGQDLLPDRMGIASGMTLGLPITIGGLMTPLLGMVADQGRLAVAVAVLAVFPAAACALSIRLSELRAGDSR